MKTIEDIKEKLNEDEREKLKRLEARITTPGKLVVAFSGGVDSTFLLKAACDILKGDVTAVTIRTELHSGKEISEALLMAESLGVKHVKMEMSVLGSEEIENNLRERCYHCKTKVFTAIQEYAGKNGIKHVADGTNADDTGAHRPGLRALEELNVSSPLKDAGLGKNDIRRMSKLLGLETWEKPANPCLATRFPYGTKLTEDAIRKVDLAEDFIRNLGFKNVRVRSHGDTARIEVDREMIPRISEGELPDKISRKLNETGFRYVTLDLGGFRSGSMDDL